jgi:hypothetical protein
VRGDSGMWCSLAAFLRLAGIDHRALTRSTPSHVSPMNSPGHVAVGTAISRVSAAIALRSWSFPTNAEGWRKGAPFYGRATGVCKRAVSSADPELPLTFFPRAGRVTATLFFLRTVDLGSLSSLAHRDFCVTGIYWTRSTL